LVTGWFKIQKTNSIHYSSKLHFNLTKKAKDV
jgi:hypothetical protein